MDARPAGAWLRPSSSPLSTNGGGGPSLLRRHGPTIRLVPYATHHADERISACSAGVDRPAHLAPRGPGKAFGSDTALAQWNTVMSKVGSCNNSEGTRTSN